MALKYAVQLRNLVWASSKNDVYVMHNSSVLHWSPINRKRTEVLNAARPIVPSPEVWLIHNCAKSILTRIFISWKFSINQCVVLFCRQKEVDGLHNML